MNSLLLCTLGGSWAVIAEVYAFLAPEHLPLYREHPQADEFAVWRRRDGLSPPEEIWVCTTHAEKVGEGIERLLAWHCRLPAPPALRIWQVEGTDQLASPPECERMRELIARVCLRAREHAGAGRLVLSLAGGRKTMSADLQWAGSLFGCDALVHVVGGDPLPKALTNELTVERMLAPLRRDLCSAVVPLIVGRGMRSELLDIVLDGQGPITAAAFAIGLPESRRPLAWRPPADSWLTPELQRREREGGQLLGNYLAVLSRAEHHENWRSLYRLPPRVIERLRSMPLGEERRPWLQELPKADLHRHLGGCLDLAQQRRVGRAVWEHLTAAERDAALRRAMPLVTCADWPWDWPDALRSDPAVPRSHGTAALLVEASDECLRRNLYGSTEPRVALKSRHRAGFSAYERPGELSGSALLTHSAALETYAAGVVENAVAEGLAYLELRGSPQKYGDGLRFLECLHAALKRAMAGLAEERRPVFRFILIADRRDRDRIGDVVRMAAAAKAELPDFIAGLDLAGDEGTTRPEEIAHLFRPAFEMCLPITIHAGETESAESIWQAAYHLHADRIGHGLTISGHRRLADRFRDRGICLELCPSSNREVVGFHDPAVADSLGLGRYPLRRLWETGLPLTLCTDNPGISRTTLADEYLTASRMLETPLSCWDTLAMIKQAFVHAFLDSHRKEALLKHCDAQLYRAVLSEFAADS